MKFYLTTRRRNPISTLVKLLTRSKVSHFMMDDPERPTVLQSNYRGCFPTFNKRAFAAEKQVHTFELVPFNSEKRPLILEAYWELIPLIGAGYDFPGILGFAWRQIAFFLFGENWALTPRENRLGRHDLIFCSELFYIFLEKLAARGVIKAKILEPYNRETFHPQNALELMLKYPEVFRKVDPAQEEEKAA